MAAKRTHRLEEKDVTDKEGKLSTASAAYGASREADSLKMTNDTGQGLQ